MSYFRLCYVVLILDHLILFWHFGLTYKSIVELNITVGLLRSGVLSYHIESNTDYVKVRSSCVLQC